MTLINVVLQKYGNVGTNAVSCISQYKAAIHRLWEEQVQERINRMGYYLDQAPTGHAQNGQGAKMRCGQKELQREG
jgi:hypothetical protein